MPAPRIGKRAHHLRTAAQNTPRTPNPSNDEVVLCARLVLPTLLTAHSLTFGRGEI
jgi:hypothetical protein